MLSRYGNFIMLLSLLSTESAINFQYIISSCVRPRYLTLEYCLIFFHYLTFSFLTF